MASMNVSLVLRDDVAEAGAVGDVGPEGHAR